MATIPLVATQVKQPESPLDMMARVTQLHLLTTQGKTADLQNQEMQRQMADEDSIRKSWQTSNGDPDAFMKNMADAGVMPKNILAMQSALLQRRQAEANLTKTQNENNQASNDANRGRLLSIVNSPADQKQGNWDSELTREEQAGTLKPGAISHQYPGDDVASSWANHFAMGSVLAKEAIEMKASSARQQQADTATAEFAAKADPKSPLYAPTTAAVALGAQRGDPTSQAIQTGETQQAGAKAGAEAQAKLPYEVQLEQLRQQTARQMGTNKDAQDKIEGTVLKPYEEKMSQITELQSALQQASQGNVTAARGVLLKLIGVSNPDGTKRYNEAEAQRLLQQGSISQRFAGTVKNLLTGDQWTDQMQKDMVNFAGAQAQAAKDNLNRGIGNVNRLYGTNVGQGLVQGGSAGNTVRMKAPNGQMKDVDPADVDHFKKMGATVVEDTAGGPPNPGFTARSSP